MPENLLCRWPPVGCNASQPGAAPQSFRTPQSSLDNCLPSSQNMRLGSESHAWFHRLWFA